MAVTRSQRGRLASTVNEIQRVRAFRRFRKRYKLSDVAHRHRLKDRQRHTVTVEAHTRRS